MGDGETATYENGIYRAGDVRISDLSGRKMLPIGDDLFATCVTNSVFIDKTMLIADVLDSGFKATLFCRPRRFGKSLNWDAGHGRYDIRLMPLQGLGNPLITFELTCASKGMDADEEQLAHLACDALAQIANRSYDADAPASALRYGLAFSDKHAAVAVERL